MLLSPSPTSGLVAWPAAVLVCAVLTQLLSHHDAELPSEVLCWVILPFLFGKARALSPRDVGGLIGSRSVLGEGTKSFLAVLAGPMPVLSAIAVGIGASAFAASEFKSNALLPALPPLMLLAYSRLQSNARTSNQQNSFSPLATLIESPIASSVVALFTIITLSQGDFISTLLSLPATVAPLTAYVLLGLRTASPNTRESGTFDVENDLVPLSLRAGLVSAVLFSVRIVFLGSVSPGLVRTLALGVAKSCFWYTLILTAPQTQWMIAPVVKIFSTLATLDTVSLTSENRALAILFASILSLGQLIGLVPLHTKSRYLIWVLALLPIVPYALNSWRLNTMHSSAPNWGPDQPHPIESLIEAAETDFQDMRKRQSLTYTAAHEEYKRRYGIEPPPGFEAWFQYAVAHDSPIIDDYDGLFESISPYLQLSGKGVTELMERIHGRPHTELWMCAFPGNETEATCRHQRRKPERDRDISVLLNKLLGEVGNALKDVQILVNHLDEPRVLYPAHSAADGHFRLKELKGAPAWAEVSRHCSESEGNWNAKHPVVQQYGLPFVANRTSAMDICQNEEYRTLHGLLISPKHLRIVDGHVPIMSTGSFSTMRDILVPSPAYIQTQFQYHDSGDMLWEDKHNNLYWDGSTTGSYVRDGDSWLWFHRQRFVSFVQRLERRGYYYLQSVSGQIVRQASKLLNGRLYDVNFTRITQCDQLACRAQWNFFRTHSWTSASAPLGSRLVFDIDGNGISGRFYRLLASRSLPLKQTLLREWHDERLLPWAHYIPVSQSLEELPELVRWLTSTERGQEKAREIAEEGRRWYYEALRDVDKGVYLYRVMLEMARIQDPGREAGKS